MNNLDLLIPEAPTQTDTFRFGLVVSTDPLRVKLDGDLAPVEATPIVTAPIGTNDRVLALLHNRQLLIVGRVSRHTAVYALGDTENLNDLTDGGTYHQQLNANIAAGRNYPDDRAGLLEVFNVNHVVGDYNYVYQRYTVYDSSAVYVRSLYGSTWRPWTIVARRRSMQKVGGWDSTVEPYISGSDPSVGEINGTIHFNGAMRVRGDYTKGRIATLPSWAAPPSSLYDPVFICQGSGSNHWALRVNSSGTASWERYGPGSPTANTWLPFTVSWPANDSGI